MPTNPAASPVDNGSREKSFEIFLKKPIAQIQKEAWGRSKEVRDIRDACQKYLALYDEEGGPTTSADELVQQALQPLQLACASTTPKIAELGVRCLEKMVANAWLQGESTMSGSLDGGDLVADVIKMVLKSGESNNAQLQLVVVQTLLTITTAEHFVAHGDCLLAAIRTVFNIALGSDDKNNKRNASGTLLQMLNTVARRVTQYQLRTTLSSPMASTNHTPFDGPSRNESMHPEAPLPGHPAQNGDDTASASATDATRLPSPRPDSIITVAGSTVAGSSILGGSPTEASSEQGSPHSARAAHLATLAQQSDFQGLARALEAATPTDLDISDLDDAADLAITQRVNGTIPSTSEVAPGSDAGSSLPPPSPQRLPPGAAEVAASLQAESGDGGSPRGSPRKSQLTVMEKDVLQVLIAFCKLASREPASGNTESYLHQGKLLALELLVKVLQNPQHNWDAVREDFTRHLRQPMCITLLRNVAAADAASFQLAVKLLVCILTLPRFRHGLKAELGAFYPLLVLNPLEQDTPDLGNLATTLAALRTICSDAQLVVDLFVNYDCDLHAANLYEKTLRALSRIARQLPDPNFPGNQQAKAEHAATVAQISDSALRCIMAVVGSLDAWAGPIKDSASRLAAEARLVQQQLASSTVSSSAGTVSEAAATTEAERFGAAKAHKASMLKGLVLFNSHPVKGMASLVASGVVERTPQNVAKFLRDNAATLDKTAIGEYLGHHEDFEISVMHAYVDMEGFQGLAIDVALRRLLHEFRLPGEAQKIDRIMEKFAERYCRDNPAVFRTAGAAYVLAFSVIMLNTDAHNPLVDRRIQKPDFVAMNVHEVEGQLEPTLAADQLEGIYERIVAKQFVVRDALPGASTEDSKSWHMRLASNLGLTQLTAPLKPPVAGGRRRNVSAEKQKIIEAAERAMSGAGPSGNTWFVATHAEHTSPMLQVSGELIYEAVSARLEHAPNLEAAEPSLNCLVMTIKLAGLLGLSDLCELCVGALVRTAGITAPAPFGSEPEATQLSAVKALISLALGQEAGLLGSSWPLILRAISDLEALQMELTRPVSPSAAAAAAAAAAEAQGGANPFSRMLHAMGLPMGKKEGPTPESLGARYIQPASPAGHHRNSADHMQPPVREAPGAPLVLWMETEGLPYIEQLYARSAALDGDAVVVFIRALCAVSQEELEQAVPRVFSLQKLVECAYHNMSRIRFVWSRLWSVISTHLVSAACHHLNEVAMNAVDSLRQLVNKLLARAELANFTHQEEALRPFVSVLRQCDDVSVRELTVRCITQAITAHARGLGSGWRMVLEALTRGAADAYAAVVTQSLEALQVVSEALFRGPGLGHDCFRETVRATMAGVRNQHHPELSASAVQLLLRCGRRLAERTPQSPPAAEAVAAEQLERRPSGAGQLDDGWPLLLRTLLDVLMHDTRPRVVNTAMEVVFELMHLYSQKWDEEAWRILLNQVLGLLFKPPIEQAAALAGSEAAEEAAAAAFLSRIDRYFPQLCDQMDKVTPTLRLDLLSRLTEISLYWFGHPSEQLAAAGLHGLHRLVTALGARMDSDGWRVVLAQLTELVNLELAEIIPAAHHFAELSRAHLGLQNPPSADGPLQPMAPEQAYRFRKRCRMLLQLQKCLDQVHQQCACHMPPDVQLSLLALLQTSVDTVMDFNLQEAPFTYPPLTDPTSDLFSPHPHSPAAPSASSTYPVPPSPAPEPPSTPPATSPRLIPDPAFTPPSDSHSPTPPAPLTPPPSAPPRAPLPQLVLTSPACSDPLTPALMRLELEGGIILLAALNRALDGLSLDPNPDAATSKAAASAHDALVAFCDRILTVAADAASKAAYDSPVAKFAKPFQVVNVRASVAWDHTVRAPLVAQALEVLRNLDAGPQEGGEKLSKAQVQRVAALFPKLAKLMCYAHPVVQQALSLYVATRVGPILELAME